MRHHITAIHCGVCVIVSNVNFCLVYQIRCPFATLKFLFVNILIVLLVAQYSHGFFLARKKYLKKKITNSFQSQHFNLMFNLSLLAEIYCILTAGMTSAGFRRFFVRRQNNMNTTKIKMIITNDIDATMILNTGLVSEIMQIEFKYVRILY